MISESVFAGALGEIGVDQRLELVFLHVVFGTELVGIECRRIDVDHLGACVLQRGDRRRHHGVDVLMFGSVAVHRLQDPDPAPRKPPAFRNWT